ncbi:threonine/serine exporter family protein [Endozoicomonas sp. Mp262]|uniref:threonine/serine exporter family protein n=1 Tax=Endozoicomonas sp. Mp262 TaxID=2919499 RepID=UPI0021DAAFAD
MASTIILVITNCFWASLAALGFAIFFTVPKRALWAVAVLASVAYGSRSIALMNGLDLIVGSLVASCFISLIGVQLAHWVHTPTMVFVFPSVIPMVPGVFAYRTMMGLMEISRSSDVSAEFLLQTASNGLNTIFILLALAVGVSLPSLLFKNRSVKEIKLLRWLRRKTEPKSQ